MGWVVGIGVLLVATVVAAGAMRDQIRAFKSTSYADRFMLPGKPIRRRPRDEGQGEISAEDRRRRRRSSRT